MRTDHVTVAAEAAYAAGTGTGARTARDVLGILAGATHHVAAGLLYWDAGARVHRVLASPGYGSAFVTQIHRQLMDGPVFRRLLGVGTPLRFDDPPHDFRGMMVYREILAPAGYGDGLSAALSVDGRYTGMLHMSADHHAAFDDDVRDLIQALTPVLARLCDVERPSLSLLDDADCAQLVVGGEVRAVPGRPMSPVLTDNPALPAVVARFLASSVPVIRGLWAHETGWRLVTLARVRGGVTGNAASVLVGDRPCELPYHLSPREVDVLTLVTRGASNAQVAADLVVTQRTVATHMEHILDKLSCGSRTAAAALATREGLVRLELD